MGHDPERLSKQATCYWCRTRLPAGTEAVPIRDAGRVIGYVCSETCQVAMEVSAAMGDRQTRKGRQRS